LGRVGRGRGGRGRGRGRRRIVLTTSCCGDVFATATATTQETGTTGFGEVVGARKSAVRLDFAADVAFSLRWWLWLRFVQVLTWFQG